MLLCYKSKHSCLINTQKYKYSNKKDVLSNIFIFKKAWPTSKCSMMISLNCIILLINVEIPIIVGISTFTSRIKLMLSSAEHEKGFIISKPAFSSHLS